jgi:hypothetical protein
LAPKRGEIKVLSSGASVFCAAKDPGEPREASRSLRRDNRAFGSLPYLSLDKPPPRLHNINRRRKSEYASGGFSPGVP